MNLINKYYIINARDLHTRARLNVLHLDGPSGGALYSGLAKEHPPSRALIRYSRPL